MLRKKAVLLLMMSILIACFFLLDLNEYLTLEYFNQKRMEINNYYVLEPIKAGLIYFGCFTALLSLSLPGSLVVTVVGGAVFGFWWGVILTSFASAIGSTIAFLIARYLFRDVIRKRFLVHLTIVNEGLEKDGALYLFMLRLVPILPFPVINLITSVTPIRVTTFYLVTQVGMLPLFMILTYAGTQISKIESPTDVLSLELITAFVLIGIFPLVAKKTVTLIKSRNRLRRTVASGEQRHGPQ